MKKITSMFLALVMALSLTVPAFASSGTVKVEGSIQLPTINVTLPTTASMIMNPYSMDVKLNPKDTTTVNDQIVSPVMEVTNLSNIDMQVGIQIAGAKGKGDAKFAAAAPTAGATTKEAFIYAVFQIGAAGMTISDPGNVTADAANVAVLEEPASGATTATPKDVTNFGTVAGTVADSNNTLAATVLNTTTNKQEAAPTGVLGFKFFGTTSDVTTWTDKDTLGATLTFKFTPVANNAGGTPPAGAVTATITEGSSKNSIASGETASLTVALSGGKTIDSVAWTSSDASSTYVSLGGSTNATEIVSWVSAGGSVTITATVTYDTTETATATFTLGTT